MLNNNLLYCNCCNYKAHFQSEFNKHLQSQKHKRHGKPKEINCDTCDYIATTNWNLKIHKVMKRCKKSLIFCDPYFIKKKSKIFLNNETLYY